jgi:lysozyme family protein
MAAFDEAFKIVIGEEGGYVNDPNDPGGETKYGISKAAYPSLNIKDLTLDTAKAIYQKDYWTKARCDELPGCVATMVFDSAVNNGVGRAIRLLQMAANVPADGQFGQGTMTAVKVFLAGRPASALMVEFQARRMVYMADLYNWHDYGLGWSRRLVGLMLLAAGVV